MWLVVDKSLINNAPDWFYRDMWISDGKALFIGKYHWQQGHNPDRLISNYYGNVSALDGYYVTELVYPSLPLVEKI